MYTINPNFFGPKGPPIIFAHKKDLSQGARIFTIFSLSLVSIYINLKFERMSFFKSQKQLFPILLTCPLPSDK